VEVLMLVAQAITENPNSKVKAAAVRTLAAVCSSAEALRIPAPHVDKVFGAMIGALSSCLSIEEVEVLAADALGRVAPQALVLEGAGALTQAAAVAAALSAVEGSEMD
jgi:hypothetical protein